MIALSTTIGATLKHHWMQLHCIGQNHSVNTVNQPCLQNCDASVVYKRYESIAFTNTSSPPLSKRDTIHNCNYNMRFIFCGMLDNKYIRKRKQTDGYEAS